MQLVVVGLSHHSAPLEIREKLAFSPDRQPEALTDLAAQPGVSEAVLVSTCNRTEVYCRVEEVASVRDWLARGGAKNGPALESHPYAPPRGEARRPAFPAAPRPPPPV